MILSCDGFDYILQNTKVTKWEQTKLNLPFYWDWNRCSNNDCLQTNKHLYENMFFILHCKIQ